MLNENPLGHYKPGQIGRIELLYGAGFRTAFACRALCNAEVKRRPAQTVEGTLRWRLAIIADGLAICRIYRDCEPWRLQFSSLIVINNINRTSSYMLHG